MQKVIQYMKKGFFLGIGMSMGLSIFVIGLIFVKGTDPLTATDGETLTAAKWNALVSEAKGRKYVSDWINVSTSSTAPGDGVYDGSHHNLYTINHGLNTQYVNVAVYVKCSDGKVYLGNTIDSNYDGHRYKIGYSLEVKSNNEILFRIPSHPLRGKKSISEGCAHGTTGQYKVIVTAND